MFSRMLVFKIVLHCHCNLETFLKTLFFFCMCVRKCIRLKEHFYGHTSFLKFSSIEAKVYTNFGKFSLQMLPWIIVNVYIDSCLVLPVSGEKNYTRGTTGYTIFCSDHRLLMASLWFFQIC